MFCPKCGKKNNNDAKFCNDCGMNLDDSEVTNEKSGSPNSGPPIKFLIILCVILVAGLGISAGYIFQGHNTPSNSSSVTAHQSNASASNSNSTSNAKKSTSTSDKSNSNSQGTPQQSSSSSASSGSVDLAPSDTNGICWYCQGTGVCKVCEGSGESLDGSTCAICHGTGICPKCGGTGRSAQ